MNKAERQLNLAFILLSEKKGLTRQKIKSSIRDYRNSTSDSAFERMFERDKDDLKRMGFTIKIAQDIYASSDEIYYRVSADSIFIGQENYSLAEKFLLQMALLSLRELNISDDVIIRKIESIFPNRGFRIEIGDRSIDMINIESVIEAISQKKRCLFQYSSTSNDKPKYKERNVTPIHLVIRNKTYYLVSFCHDKKDYRVFRFDKIQGKIQVTQNDTAEYNLNKVKDLIELLNESDSAHKAKIKLKNGHSFINFDFPLNRINLDDNQIEISFGESSIDQLVRLLAANLSALESIDPDWLGVELDLFLRRSVS
jgi:proteasome accessory factor B